MASPEDTVLVKLEWYRLGREVSERQWRDILSVMLAKPDLDHDYMERWAARLGVSDLLQRARSEVADFEQTP